SSLSSRRDLTSYAVARCSALRPDALALRKPESERTMDDRLTSALARRVIPVVTIGDHNAAIGIADALIRGGLPVAEITFRSEAAEQAISTIAKETEVVVGAGTVIGPGLV